MHNDLTNIRQMSHYSSTWTYKGHTCIITEDVEHEENIKLWHEVITPDGKRLTADISPYCSERRALELWIDAGYPSRNQGQYPIGPLDLTDLQRLAGFRASYLLPLDQKYDLATKMMNGEI